MDVFRSYVSEAERIESLEEMIRRREAAATGGGRRSRDPGAGSRSTDDASMRLLDYVDNVERLRADLKRAKKRREEDKDCALYLTEMLPGPLGGVMARTYLEGKSAREAAEEMGYSVSHIKRLRRQAEKLCRGVRILSWDRKHVPVIAMPEE